MGCIESTVTKEDKLDKSGVAVYVANSPSKKSHSKRLKGSEKTVREKLKEVMEADEALELKKKTSITSIKAVAMEMAAPSSEGVGKPAPVETDDSYRHWRPTETGARYRTRIDTRVRQKYEIKALIGRGNFSRVVRVEHRASRQPYAIKMIDRDQGQGIFEAELAVLRRVRHRNVIQLVEVFETRDKIYMVMELATGGELLDRIIAKGFFTEADATRVLQMVLEGVFYLHSLGIAHRDLKPENLLYYHPGKDSKILITDFGLSHTRLSGEDVQMRTACGTHEYIAPEMLAGRPYTDRIDMWAIGVISYILLSGRMPFEGDNRMRLFRKILRAKYSYIGEPWKDISPLAKDFIDSLLVIDPSRRLPAAQSLRHEWIVTHAAGSSNKNLHLTISSNLLQSQARAANTGQSGSGGSGDGFNGPSNSSSTRSSGRSAGRRLRPEDVAELHKDPSLRAELSSMGGTPPG